MKIFGNGNFYSGNESNDFFTFLGVENGKIIFAENTVPDECSHLPVIDLKGKTVIPAFGDNHMHFLSYAYFLGGFDWRDYDSLEKAVSGLSEFSANNSNSSVLVGFGCSEHSMAENRLPTREDLDKADKKRPVFVIKYDGHAGVGNTQFIKKLPKNVLALRGADTKKGWFLNESFFPAADFAAKSVPAHQMIKRMVRASKELAKYGISFADTTEGVGYPLDLDVDLTRVTSKFLVQDFKIFFQTMNTSKVRLRGLKQIGGCFDTALDGCFGSLDAALNEPYSNDQSNKGILFYKDREVRDFLFKTHRHNIQTALHAIGDRAVDQCVNSFADAHEKYPRPDRRNILIHGDLVSERTIEKAAGINLVFAVQPSFLYWREEPQEYLDKILGKRADKLLPIRSLIQSGIKVTAGSDAPCTIPDPIHGIWCAVNHPNEKEQISLFEAIKMYTANLSWSRFQENIRGKLQKNMLADFVILDKDIFKVSKEKIRDIKVEALFIKGQKIDL